MTQRLDIYGKLFTEASKPNFEPQIIRNPNIHINHQQQQQQQEPMKNLDKKTNRL